MLHCHSSALHTALVAPGPNLHPVYKRQKNIGLSQLHLQQLNSTVIQMKRTERKGAGLGQGVVSYMKINACMKIQPLSVVSR